MKTKNLSTASKSSSNNRGIFSVLLLITSILSATNKPCNANTASATNQPPTVANTALELQSSIKDAENGAPLAQYLIGIHYWHEEDFNQGILWLEKAALNGNVYAQYKLGREYGDGFKIDKNRDKSLHYYLMAIDQGYAPAQRQLGMCYYYGWQGYPEDLKKSFQYNLMAAEQGHVGGQSELATMYMLGKGVAVDRKKSVFWENRAKETRTANKQKQNDSYDALPLVLYAKKGNHFTEYLVGLHFSSQEEYIPELGNVWINKAATAENMYAQYKMGFNYWQHDFLNNGPKDIQKALEYYHLAAKQGYAPAQYMIGMIHMDGTGVPLDQEKGIFWYEKAAENGFKMAQTTLARGYYVGEDSFRDPKSREWSTRPFPKDLEKSFKYYRMSAEQGDASSQFLVGFMYMEGEGVKKDYKQGVFWFEKAAENGDDSAQAGLGSCYYLGNEGVLKDYKQAFNYYFLAAKQNHAQAQYTVGFMYMRGQGVIEDYKLGIEWLKKSAFQNNENAQYELGLCYYRGTGVLQDYTEAYAWSLLAVMNGGEDTLKSVLQNELSTEQIMTAQARAKELLKEIEFGESKAHLDKVKP